MTFSKAIQTGFAKYAVLSGRASRSEYWFWILFVFMGSIGTAVLDMMAFGANSPFSIIFTQGTFLPGITVLVRRLHDTDRSGWWWLVVFIPLVGFIVLLVLLCLEGTNGPNRFGDSPLRQP